MMGKTDIDSVKPSISQICKNQIIFPLDKIVTMKANSEITILVCDDEIEIADLLEVMLTNEGFNVVKTNTASEALEAIHHQSIDLALLDVMLPDMDGFKLCTTIRKDHLFPILMLTARVADVDKITGLTIGADDYITKPFNPLEVIARVKTQLRRFTRYNPGMASSGNDHTIDIRGLSINKSSHKCTLYDHPIDLTPLEFDILWYLASHKGQVVSSETLFENVWGEQYLDSNNTVMAHIARLRDKLNEPKGHPRFIKTVWGVGYMIDE